MLQPPSGLFHPSFTVTATPVGMGSHRWAREGRALGLQQCREIDTIIIVIAQNFMHMGYQQPEEAPGEEREVPTTGSHDLEETGGVQQHPLHLARVWAWAP